MDNTNASFTWVKRITEIGLSMMTPNAAKDRAAGIMDASAIHADALADLIDECAGAAGALVEESGDSDGRISQSDMDLIKSTLGKIDGRDAVASANPNELAEWVRDIAASVEGTAASA